MNLPETQQRMRADLRSIIARFLDTAPDGQIIARASVVIGILKEYFETQYEDEDADVYDRSKAETVLTGLRMARKLLGTDESDEKLVAEALASGPPTEAQIKRREEFDAAVKARGKEHWWDLD
jgi:hypothetical protein